MGKLNIMTQYKEMKAKHPDAILLFRVGDFYESFMQDAIDISTILGITSTRKADKNTIIELAGFPHHALDVYLPKIVRAGRRVAICEPLEQPQKNIQPKNTDNLKKEPKSANETSAPDKNRHTVKPLQYVFDFGFSQPSAVHDSCQGINEYKIPQIKLSYVSDSKTKERVLSSKDAYNILRSCYDDDEIDYIESFSVMYLNRAKKVLGVKVVSKGGTDACLVDTKVIMTGALLSNAHGIILCHNHPSGNLSPSPQDNQITNRINEASKLLDIKLLDHIIMIRNGYYSYKDEGRL